MAAEDICKDYASSLEDLTFNSKPLINVLTMLADENSQHAADIIKLIEKRIYEVTIEQKLPSLYLMDSIVKNIGKEYISAVSPCIVALFTHVFEQADEKIRMSMFKLRNTWLDYFPGKILHELDCSVHKRDSGWPVIEPPPPSPSIHINPKFLSKVEKNNEESSASCSSSDEAKIMEEFERKKKELEQLEGEQMRKEMMQLEELQMKYELIKKKQEKDRQDLLKEQKEQILKMRLQQEEMDTAEESSSDSGIPEGLVAVKQRDPRLKKVEQVTDSKTDTDKAEKLEEQPPTVKEASVLDKPVDKVGFDLEFVPLDKDDSTNDTTPSVDYNRDRPLGRNRYFRKDPKAKITKSDSDSGSDFADNKDYNTHGGKKRVRGVEHRNYRQRPEPSEENDRHETMDERKGSGKGRGRRRLSADRPGNHSDDRTGDLSVGHDRPDGRDQRPGEQPENALDHSGVRRGDREHLIGRRGDSPGQRDHLGNRTGRRPEDHSGRGRPGERGERSRGRLSKRPDNRADIGHRHPLRREHDYENMHGGRHDRHDEWTRGRGQRRPQRGHLMERQIEGQLRHPQPIENTGRLAERRDQGLDRPDGMPFERGEEPPFKKSRPSPPRPLFSEQEISEIRGQHRDSPEHFPYERSEFHEPWRHDSMRQPPPEFFNNQGPHLGPRFPRDAPFPPRGMPREFLRPPQHFSGEVEIPMELALDNESEILRSAEHRLRAGEISVEQHHELLEKLHQLYELQKWQRRRSLDVQPQHETPHPTFHPPGIPPHTRPMVPETHLDHEHNQMSERMVVGEPSPDMFARQTHPSSHLNHPVDLTVDGRPHSPIVEPMLPPELPVQPANVNPAGDENPPSSLVMEKQTVDDLFKRLMDVGIITKINQGLSPARAMTPPVVEAQILKEIPVPQIPELPEIMLTLDHLRRRYDGVIMELHRGTQCSSCGLRFKEAKSENYRQHLDWHFRMNRKEKETVAAHRNWFITTDDWLEFESSEDPKLKARSDVFEAESEGESEKSEDLQEGSCPVLFDDTETEKQCDICLEKFETFWDETSEDWHYKNAVRVDRKTYHYLCYQDTKETVNSDVEEASDERENSADHEDVSSDTLQDNEAVTIKSSVTDDKPSTVTQDTSLESGVDSVVQETDELAVNNSNKEEIKTESS